MKLLTHLTLVAGLAALFIALAVVPVQSQINRAVCDVPGSPHYNSAFCQEVRTTRDATPEDNPIYGPDGIITRIVSLLSLIIGVVAIIMVIIGGIRYVVSSGDPNNTTKAKNTILYALAGLLVAVFAQTIIIFVISRL